MNRIKTTTITLLLILIGGVCITGKASYFKSNFFPIGLTGLGWTGHNIPYGNQGWVWTTGNKNELDLIDDLGINCIGCEDAWQKALIDFAGNGSFSHTYLDSICMELTENGNPTVYLITASYGAVSKRFDKNIIFKYTEANL